MRSATHQNIPSVQSHEPQSIASYALRQQLKQGTAAEHHHLESQLDLLRPGLDVHRYRCLLERFHGFYRAWEAAMQPILAAHLPGFYADRRKLPLLASDLRSLGVDPSTLPVCTDLPGISNLPAAIGSLYVIEGSTLGGQLIHRHLRRVVGLSSSNLTFFNGYGDQTGACWREFLEVLERYDSPETNHAAVASARATFQSLSRWFAEVNC